MSFKLRMEEAARKTGSRIVLALDLPPDKPERLLTTATDILEKTHPYICAIKLNHHLILPLGLFGHVQELLTQAKGHGLPAIMDCKINDIGNTNQIISEYYFKAGFDAVIANPFVGWEEGMKPVLDTARQMNRGVILLVYMSHKGASEGYGQRIFTEETNRPVCQYEVFAKKALRWNADGVVVGATYPEKIRKVYAILGKAVPVYSPGIGPQGGRIQEAARSGAEYLIVGREITMAENPGKSAEKLRDSIQRAENSD